MEHFLDFLPAFVLFGSAIWFWISVLVVLVLFFTSDINENGYLAAVSFAIFLGITYFWSNFNIFSFLTLWNVLIYLGIGLIYAAIRTLFFGRKKKLEALTKVFKEPASKEHGDWDTEAAFRRDTLSTLKGNVSRWWFLFPVSMINWALTDLFKDVWNWIYSKMSILFERIFDLGFNSKR